MSSIVLREPVEITQATKVNAIARAKMIAVARFTFGGPHAVSAMLAQLRIVMPDFISDPAASLVSPEPPQQAITCYHFMLLKVTRKSSTRRAPSPSRAR